MDSRDAILTTAIPLFARNGVAAVSIRDIASEANVAIPTIYHHFGDKQRLYQACCSIVFAKANTQLRAAIDDADPPREQVLSFVTVLYRLLAEDTELSKLFLRELADHDEPGLVKLAEESFVTAFDALYGAVRQMIRRVPDPLSVISIFALTFGLAQMSQMKPALHAHADPAPGSPQTMASFIIATMFPASGTR